MTTSSLSIHPISERGQCGLHRVSLSLSLTIRDGLYPYLPGQKLQISIMKRSRESLRDLLESIHSQGYDYSLGLITVFFLRDVNSSDAKADHLLATESCLE